MILDTIRKQNSFPPAEWQSWYKLFEELAVWYSGDPLRLATYYLNQFQPTEIGYFWSSIREEESRESVHLPIAGDVAQMSASLLFSETPEFQFDSKSEPGKRIQGTIDDNGFINMLLEGSEMAAALSGLFIKLDYDPVLSEFPLLTLRTPANAFPEFRSGRLTAVTFHREVKRESGGAIFRLFEDRRIENGKLNITYKLFKGSVNKFGVELPIDHISETAALNLQDEVLDIPVLGVVYIPNKRPNRLVPGSAIGESDYRECIGLMDSLDFTWSSWMRDIELGLGQIIVDEGLTSEGKFSKLQRAFVRLNMDNIRLTEGKYEPIKPVQFKLRVEEHMKTCDQLTRQIVGMCGYAPQSFGLVEYGQQRDSGTALRIRERKSLLTRQKKERYWIPELSRLFKQLQLFDAVKRGTKYEPEVVTIVPQDSIIQDETEKSEVVRNLDQAKAASTYIKVKMVHPDWSEEDIEKEVTRIRKEQGLGYEDNPFESLGKEE